MKEALRVRHYVRYMDDFVLLSATLWEARRQLAAVREFLEGRLRLSLNSRGHSAIVVSRRLCRLRPPSGRPGRIRRRGVRRLWRRLPVLQNRRDAGVITSGAAHASVASWFGLAKHADAFRLSRAIFAACDVQNRGKRLLVRQLGG